MQTRALIAFFLPLVVVATAVAHETWMMPSQFAAKVGDNVRIDVSSGMTFPHLESPIQADRIQHASLRLGGEVMVIDRREVAANSLVLQAKLPKAGLATLWLELKPRELDLSDDKVAEYLDEIDATSDIRALWATQRGKIPWKETYTKHAKTFVAVGDAGADRSWSRSVGSALEILPTVSPVAITAGTDVTVELRFNSRPYPGLPVGCLVEGTSEHVFRKTNAAGKAKFPMTRAGRAKFFTVRLQFDKVKKAWASDFSTMTVEVRPR